MVFDMIGIEIHAFHHRPCPAVIIDADRVIQQKFGPSLGTVDFERDHRSWPDQNSILAFFRDHKGTLLDAEAAAKFSLQHHGATPADSAC